MAAHSISKLGFPRHFLSPLRSSKKYYSRSLRCLGHESYQFVPFFQIDSFSPEPYGGNPAAVLLIPPSVQSVDEKVMMKVAGENNLSETCYVKIRSSNTHSENPFVEHNSFNLKWFTPTNEVNLCGHGTLASAAAIFNIGNQNNEIIFHTLSGELIAKRKESLDSMQPSSISLDFPLNVPVVVTEEHEYHNIITDVANMMLKEAGGTDILDIIKLAYCQVTKKLIVHCKSKSSKSDIESLESLSVPPPDRVLAFHKGEVVTGVSILVKGERSEKTSGGYDFCSRYFSPWNGIPEDPVNGSSHTVLAPYWMNEEVSKRGGSESVLYARQASPRGGDIALEVDFEKRRVSMTGPAAIAIVGKMAIPANI